MDEGLEIGMFFPGLCLSPPNDGVEPGQHLDVLGRTSIFGHPTLEIPAEILPNLQGMERGEDTLRNARRQLFAGFRGPRLEQHGMALRWTGHVERPSHREIRAP